MLTRLEVDGFKNLLGLDVYFGPYTCIAGPNSVGKSNVFDVIEFLSLLADHPFMEAVKRLRSSGDKVIEPASLFWNNAEDDDSPVMSLGFEMIVPDKVTDDFGHPAEPTTTFLRYDLRLRYLLPESGFPQTGRIVLEHESLTHINLGAAHRHLPWSHSKKNFRDAVVHGRRSGAAYISTSVEEDGEVLIAVHQDGGSRGKPRPSPAARTPRTIVSTTTADDQTILAARREMQQWRMLALEPSAMRNPDSSGVDPHPTASGAHLAATLYRMARDHGPDIYSEVAAEASALIDIRELVVDYDQRRDSLTLLARIGTGPLLPASSLSDGTLRFLTLCIMPADDSIGGLLCMEEPENGIHPGRIETMVDLVQSLGVDPHTPPGTGNPMRQIMVNTHSPLLVQHQDKQNLLAAVPAKVRRGKSIATTMRLLPLPGTWRASWQDTKTVARSSLSDYLTEPPTSLLSIEGLA